MTLEIHPATPTTDDRRVMERAIQMLHEQIGREIQSIDPTSHPAGRILMVHKNGTITTIPDLSRTAEDSNHFLAHMRRVVAVVKPEFVVYANLFESEDGAPGREAIQVVAESARRAVAIGTSTVRRRDVHPPVIEALKTEFMSHGDVLTTEIGAFYAALAEGNDCPKPTLH